MRWEAGWGDGDENAAESCATDAADPMSYGSDRYEEEAVFGSVPGAASVESQQVGGGGLGYRGGRVLGYV